MRSWVRGLALCEGLPAVTTLDRSRCVGVKSIRATDTPEAGAPRGNPGLVGTTESGEGQRLVVGVVQCYCLSASESVRQCQLRRFTRSRGTRASMYLLKKPEILGRHASDGVESWSGSIKNLDIVNVVDGAHIKLEC